MVRTTSLPADERRAAIAEATLPLLLAHGAAVTTRQIAEAAGIAEGTIFRVFPDKESVICAAVELAFDPGPITDGVAGIAARADELDLEERMIRAVELLQERVSRIFQVMSIVGAMGSDAARKPAFPQRRNDDLDGLAAIFEPDRDQLRRDPRVAAQLLRAATFGGTHPMFAVDGPLEPHEIVSLVLDGVRRSLEGPSPC